MRMTLELSSLWLSSYFHCYNDMYFSGRKTVNAIFQVSFNHQTFWWQGTFCHRSQTLMVPYGFKPLKRALLPAHHVYNSLVHFRGHILFTKRTSNFGNYIMGNVYLETWEVSSLLCVTEAQKVKRNSLQGPLRVAKLCVFSILVPGLLLSIPLYMRYNVYIQQAYPLGMSDMRLLEKRVSTTWCQVKYLCHSLVFLTFVKNNWLLTSYNTR